MQAEPSAWPTRAMPKRAPREARAPMMRGVRGATTVEEDTPAAIEGAVHELLAAMVAANGVVADDLAAVFFSVTADLRSAYPAASARSFGWTHVPLLDVREADGIHALPRCIRVLALWNTLRRPGEVRHIYLRGASNLRPDLRQPEEPGLPWGGF